MITRNLFESALVTPARQGANKLLIVSGYATAAMAFHHLDVLRREVGRGIAVNLIIGMTPNDGISRSNHLGFIELAESEFNGQFTCSYVMLDRYPVHSKVYAWLADDEPLYGFVGSANYTQNAFLSNQREVLAICDAEDCLSYFNELVSDSIYSTHPEVDEYIQISNDQHYNRRRNMVRRDADQDRPIAETTEMSVEHVRCSLLDRNGNLPATSGLNWGQREGRERNQAYIRLTADIYHSDFFPPVGVHFTVQTDDHRVLICTRAQQNGKAIHTPHNNSLLGEYFRNRLGLANGAFITKEDLIRYGRTDVDFYKIDDETYVMDFSV
ncbi:restriction endonuclease PLD domain-containing protein [Alicyclobacillus tolerans]|uniref:NgoFVII restriction endonuclease n=1 Tax=Alicyclobacillus tolerans TaxID=90970 RepID=A0A1M6YAU3_9BACL|nr:restriction endonuclease PLD domain-containing protein [Alicyclobacillus montanus]SHL15390.1 NgoFVII restriction endonuclease [Alicyclobacillus montanus]